MEHIKTFKVFESGNDIVNYCKDILLPLNDDNLIVDVVIINKRIIIEIYTRKKLSINLKNYEDELNMLKDYLENNGYVYSFINNWIEWDGLIGDNDPFKNNKIYFSLVFERISKIKRMFK